jgi:hypothetical protein
LCAPGNFRKHKSKNTPQLGTTSDGDPTLLCKLFALLLGAALPLLFRDCKSRGSLLQLGFLWWGEDLFSDPMGSLSAGAAPCRWLCSSDLCASCCASPSTSLVLSLSRDTNAALSPIVLHEIVAPRLVRGSCVLLPPAQRSGLRQTQPSSTRAPNLIPRLQSLSRACWLHIASLLHQHQNWRPFSR